MKLIDSTAKTNWKFVATFLFLSVVAGGGYYFLTQKPEEQKVEKVVYTKAAWAEDVGRVRTLIVANKDGTGRRVLLEKMPNEYPGISASTLLIPERNEVVVVTQGKYYPYDLDIEKIHTESGQRTKLATYKEGGRHGMSLLSVILSPDKKKIALTIHKNLFTIDITKEKPVAFKPFYTDTQSREGESIAPVFWDSLGNIYLKSFAGRPEENRINDFIKVSSQGKREELSQEQKAFFKTPSYESQVVDFRLYPSPDGKFAAWVRSSSKEGTLSQKILVYSVEERLWFIRLKKDSIQILENEEAISFRKEKLDSPLHNVEIKERTEGDISNAQLYIDGALFDSIPDYSDYGGVGFVQDHGKAFEILGSVSGAPIIGWEKDWQEKAIDRQEEDLLKFKQSALYPTYLPTGWKESNLPKAQTGQWNEQDALIGGVIYFRNNEGGLLFIQEQKTDASIPQGFIAVRDYISEYSKEFITSREDLIINGKNAVYFTVSNTKQFVTWSSDSFDIAIVCFDSEGCSLEKEELIKIANSMKLIAALPSPPPQSQISEPMDTRVAREITITVKKNQWRFVPEEFEVNQGEKVVLTVVNEDEYDHGIAIDQFGISQRVPANSIIKVEFMVTQAGDFPFYSSVPSGGGIVDGEKRTYYDMVGKIHVLSLIPETK